VPTWLYGIYRTGLQFAWATVVAWAAAKGYTLPDNAPAWLDEAVFGLIVAAFTGLIQWMETRRADSLVGRVSRMVAKWLMLGAPRVIEYQKPVDESREYLRSTMGR